ncbi:ankyrin repeat domain-containing protein [Candidatus Dependentiae bacterium]|nr:ankyrin repeat domain-containing protein [Candidatus Dependentiae bacterium]
MAYRKGRMYPLFSIIPIALATSTILLVYTTEPLPTTCTQTNNTDPSYTLMNTIKVRGSTMTIEEVDAFFCQGADIHNQNEALLHIAAACGNTAIVQNFLTRGADVTARNGAGQIALHSARSAAIAKILLEHNSPLDAQDTMSSTPLHTACLGGQDEMVKFFMQRGATTEIQNISGRTALHNAAMIRNPTLIEILLHHNAHVGPKDKIGATPLDVALCQQNTSVDPEKVLATTKLLLIHGAPLVPCACCSQAKPPRFVKRTSCCGTVCKHCIVSNPAATCQQCAHQLASKISADQPSSKQLGQPIQMLLNTALFADYAAQNHPAISATSFSRGQTEVFIGRLLMNEHLDTLDQLVSHKIISSFERQSICEPLVAKYLLSNKDPRKYRYGIEYLRKYPREEISSSLLEAIIQSITYDQRRELLSFLHHQQKLPRSLFLSTLTDLGTETEQLANSLTITILGSPAYHFDPQVFRLFGLVYLEKIAPNKLSLSHRDELASIRKHSPTTLIKPAVLAKIFYFAKEWKLKKIGNMLLAGIVCSGIQETWRISKQPDATINTEALPSPETSIPNELGGHILSYIHASNIK